MSYNHFFGRPHAQQTATPLIATGKSHASPLCDGKGSLVPPPLCPSPEGTGPHCTGSASSRHTDVTSQSWIIDTYHCLQQPKKGWVCRKSKRAFHENRSLETIHYSWPRPEPEKQKTAGPCTPNPTNIYTRSAVRVLRATPSSPAGRLTAIRAAPGRTLRGRCPVPRTRARSPTVGHAPAAPASLAHAGPVRCPRRRL